MLKFLTLALRCRHHYGKESLSPRRLEILYTLYQHQIALGLAWHEALTPLPQKTLCRPKRRKGHNLLLRLQTYQDDVLRVLYDPDVPFTNNLAEQDLRMMKCKQKISGGFRSFHGSEYFARIRGFISTARKQRWNILQSLTTIFLPDSILPAPS